MTFSARRQAVQSLRRVTRAMRHAQRGLTADRVHAVTLTVPAEVFDGAEWALGSVKAWNPETQRWYRGNFRFVQPGEPRKHFLCGGCAVYREVTP
jgi:hypothetical protein